MRTRLPTRPSIGWSTVLLPTAVGIASGLLSASAHLTPAWRVVCIGALVGLSVWLVLAAPGHDGPAVPSGGSGPAYAVRGDWQPGFGLWLRNGIEEALRATGMHPANPGEAADLCIYGPGGGRVVSRAAADRRGFAVSVQFGDRLPGDLTQAQRRTRQADQWDAVVYVVRRGAEVRAYLVGPGGDFSLVPTGGSDDAFFARLRQEMLARVRLGARAGGRVSAV